MTTQLSHAMIFVADVERMASFYVALCGFRRENTSDDGFVFLRGDGGTDVALHRLSRDMLGDVATPPAWRQDTALKLCFTVDDLAVARRSLIAGGGQAKEPWSWEATDFCECADPEGNVIQLVCRRPG